MSELPASRPIRVERLRKAYGGTVQALDGLTFTVDHGTVFGLLGPNGAGKTTAVKILTTLSRPDSGTASIGGHDVVADSAAVRRLIGVVAQRSGADIQATCRENLRLQGSIHGLRGLQLETRIDELLTRFGLIDAADRLVRTFSGGMQRRLDVALALVHQPKILFLDEPTTGLDPAVRSKLWQEIRHLTSQGLTVLITTHYMEEADRLASRIAIVDSGRVVAEGTPEDLKREIRGDAIQIELGEEPVEESLRAALWRCAAGIYEVRIVDRRVIIRVANGPREVPTVLDALHTVGAAISSVIVTGPTLEEVYLRHTGRSLTSPDRAYSREGHYQ